MIRKIIAFNSIELKKISIFKSIELTQFYLHSSSSSGNVRSSLISTPEEVHIRFDGEEEKLSLIRFAITGNISSLK
jgi:hypothetical protein